MASSDCSAENPPGSADRSETNLAQPHGETSPIDGDSSDSASSDPSQEPSNEAETDGTTGPASSGDNLPADLEQKLAENPKLREYAEDAVTYHDEALSENTRQAYASGWRDFRLFCEENDFVALPADPGTVALYLSFLAKKVDHKTGEVTKEGLSVPTLEQRLSAIAYHHEEQGQESPTSTREVKQVMAGIRRKQRHRPDDAKPLMTYHLKRMVDALPKKADLYAERKRERTKTTAGARLTKGEKRYLRLLQIRNSALLLLGYAGALRRSEIAGLTFDDVREEPGLGLVIDIRVSKTDQEGDGQLIYVRRLESEYDPVRALDTWREESGLNAGPIFRPLTRGGNVGDSAITGKTVSNVVQEAVELAGISEADEYSAHSLRAGHATQATKNGVPAEIAMNTTRHESREQFEGYVRNEEKAFESASSGQLGL
jgi:integrase